MARGSRIAHPPGAIFLQIHRWIVDEFGEAEAAVLGTLEFWDRGQEQEGQWLGRDRDAIVRHLAGLVGRNRVHQALDALIGRGWVEKKEFRVPFEKNFATRHDLRLVPAAINAFLAEHFPNSPNREVRPPDSGKSDLPTSGSRFREPQEEKEKKKKEETTPQPPATGITGAVESPTQGGGGEELNDLVEAGAWAAGKSDHAGYRRAIRARIAREGPTPEDRATLARWREDRTRREAAAARDVERRERLSAEAPPLPAEEARVRAARLRDALRGRGGP